ncbi:hypothetical protein [Phreatobacter sp.]|uniref:hypothetical protein n=1 Tax=Phreatobacter sp. TaxID=1966341 RepID=UPI003F71C7A7
MATMTVDTIHAGAAAPAPSSRTATAPATARRGFVGTLKAIYQAIVDAQDLRARTYLHGYLSHLSDEELARLGMTRDEMVRRTRSLLSNG